MTALILRAHFDGKHITLDEPCDLPPGTPVTVTVIPDQVELERAHWEKLASDGLARAYGDEEPEYTPKDIKP